MDAQPRQPLDQATATANACTQAAAAPDTGGGTCPHPQLHVHVARALLHEWLPGAARRYRLGPRNTVVVALNAGLAAYMSWLPTLGMLCGPQQAQQAQPHGDSYKTASRGPHHTPMASVATEEAECGGRGPLAAGSALNGDADANGSAAKRVRTTAAHASAPPERADVAAGCPAAQAQPEAVPLGTARLPGAAGGSRSPACLPPSTCGVQGCGGSSQEVGGAGGACHGPEAHTQDGTCSVAVVVTDYLEEALQRVLQGGLLGNSAVPAAAAAAKKGVGAGSATGDVSCAGGRGTARTSRHGPTAASGGKGMEAGAADSAHEEGPGLVVVNPFRQPWRLRSHGNALPAYSNGFMMLLCHGA